MPNVRGFVEQIEITRAGLARIFLIHADGSKGTYVIEDLDADPERFNERLSKLGILRDAMNRAEPVEIEHVPGEGGQLIDRVRRITRDDLAPVTSVESVSGFVFDLMVHSENGVLGDGEKPDLATVYVLQSDMQIKQVNLNLQEPERLVKNHQLEMLRDAQARGRVVRLLVDVGSKATATGAGNKPVRIIAVAVDNADNDFGGELASEVDGFVESLSLLHIPAVGGTSMASSFAHVRFTTAPPFTGSGNIVGLAPFTPVTINLLVMKNSLAYELFLAGLRDNLRMRASTVAVHRGRDTVDDAPDPNRDVPAGTPSAVGGAKHTPLLRMLNSVNTAATYEGKQKANLFISFGAELLAPLASASRPVWIEIRRESLDVGPEKAYCAKGTPSSDLTPQSLRDMHLPYPAVWRGLGCFNHGVYRFQLKLPSSFKITVDGKELCLLDSDPVGSKMAHACLHDLCEVVIEIEEWTCDSEFILDVYRLR
jgi:hypothetical protein